LLQHTHSVTEKLPVTKFVFYADEINEDDLWNGFEKRIQEGRNLGERMLKAFAGLIEIGFTKVCIIGSDCLELNTTILQVAFESLNKTDMVIGPVMDGGYYLLGTNKLIPEFFENKKWSTDSVFNDTLTDAAALKLAVHKLPMLNDIDNETDLRNSPLAFFV
jgi:rSAM/selenodomain-associated transferase 1